MRNKMQKQQEDEKNDQEKLQFVYRFDFKMNEFTLEKE